jgi:3-methyl-2-oxobutanoate hydroxymethyltransferase
MSNEKFSILDFVKKKKNGEKITVLTACDYPTAKLIDEAGIDSVLVGDSLGMVFLGYESTVPVTMDEMLHHLKAVRRGVQRAFLIGDMPFMSYQVSDEDAVRNAGRFVKEAACDAVKIEGGAEVTSRVESIINAGIPVMGHIGLTPQSITKLGGYKVQGKDAASADKLIKDALALEKSGCFAIVLECVPKDLAGKIAKQLYIPVIGIGAVDLCDGQVLVTHDMIGCFDKFTPKFVKKYANIIDDMRKAFQSFKEETENGTFPDDSHSY